MIYAQSMPVISHMKWALMHKQEPEIFLLKSRMNMIQDSSGKPEERTDTLLICCSCCSDPHRLILD
jgi:hypothetical protein